MSPHVLIVGGGIVGCMTAMELVQRGYRVTIVERNRIASQTSGESSWAGGGILFPLLPWTYADAVSQLTQYGANRYEAICTYLTQQTGIDCDYVNSGFLILPPYDLAAAEAWCQRYQLRYEQRPATAFGLDLADTEPALWLPEVAQVRPPYLMRALRAWLVQQGVSLVENTALLPLTETTPLSHWQTQDGRQLAADHFIVTSGAWSFELLGQVMPQLNIKPMRGQILLYKPKIQLQQILYKNGFYLIPRRDGHLLAGSTLEDVGFDASTTEAVREELRAKAEAILPALRDEPILQQWAGLRPGTPENLPTIAVHPQITNLYLNTGHFRYGLTMAPASAKRVADLVAEQAFQANH